MGFGKKEQLLLPLAQAHSEGAAAAEGEKGLGDLKPGVRRVLPRRQKRQEALPPVTRAEDEHQNDRHRAQSQPQQMLQLRAAEKQQSDRHETDHNHGPEIRLQQHQAAQHADHEQHGQQARGEACDPVLFLGQIGRQINHRHELDHLGRLNRNGSETQPAPRSFGRDSERWD